MAQSAIDCCNSALQRLGAASIISLTDNSREARACLVAYDSNRRDELRKHTWNFAIKRVAISPDLATPAFDYDYQFTLPNDCLRVLRPSDSSNEWVVEGRKILSNNDSTVYLRYIADIEDCTQWDASFYNVASVSLSIDLCETLTQSNTKFSMLNQLYDDAIKEAWKMNAFEAGPVDAPDDAWLLARL